MGGDQKKQIVSTRRRQVAKEKASTESGLEGEAWPPSGTPILLHHFVPCRGVQKQRNHFRSTLQCSRNSIRIPFNNISACRKRGSWASQQRGTKLRFPPRGVTRPAMLLPVGVSPAAVPCQRLAGSKHNLEITEIGEDCVPGFWCRERESSRAKRTSPRPVQGRGGHWRRLPPRGWTGF